MARPTRQGSRIRGGDKLRRFLRRAEAAQRSGGVRSIEVGFFRTSRYPDGTPVPLVAAVHEFGAPSKNIPERPFFRGALPGLEKELRPILEAGVDPMTMVVDHQTAALMGEATKARIQRSITDLDSPPNAPSTIERKLAKGKTSSAAPSPLIDTGKMRGSVSYRVK